MVDQLASMILLSIVLTFIGFLSACILMRLGHIKHPKSRFFIYMAVVLTASSLIFVPVFSLSLFPTVDTTNDQNTCSDKQSPPVSFTVSYGDERYSFQSPLENLINGTAEPSSRIVETSTTHEEESMYSSPQSAVCVAILYEKFFKNNKNGMFDSFLSKYDLHLDEEKIKLSSVSAILSEIISLQANASLSNVTSNTITCKFVLNSIHDQQEPPISSIPDDHSNGFVVIPIYLASIFLLISGIVYFLLSLLFGKRITLKSLDAKRCTDEKILSMIQDISKELGIKIPRVFISKGSPNAFVFGYPTTVVLSQTLLQILTENELEMTIRHELSHIKNKDIIIKPALQMLRILFLYNPVVHMTVRRMIKEREAMADLVSFTDKKDKITFVEALVKIEEYMIRFPSAYRSQAPLSSLSLWSHTKKHAGLEERFDRLFEETNPKQILSIVAGVLLLFSNLTLFAAAFQLTSCNNEIVEPVLSENCMMKNESYIYECTFVIGNDDITCQEVVTFKSDMNQGSWIHYQTEIIPLASYIMKNPALLLSPAEKETNNIFNPLF